MIVAIMVMAVIVVPIARIVTAVVLPVAMVMAVIIVEIVVMVTAVVAGFAVVLAVVVVPFVVVEALVVVPIPVVLAFVVIPFRVTVVRTGIAVDHRSAPAVTAVLAGYAARNSEENRAEGGEARKPGGLVEGV